jgi:sugar phosphate isomerase/epimerase
MWLAYNTNGLAHHRLEDGLRLLADLGYDGVALSPDVGQLDLATTGEREWEAARGLLERLQLRVVLETGARYALDPRRKHWPNLVTADEAAAERRLAWYRRALRMAQLLRAEVVSLWSGAPDVAPATPGGAAAPLGESAPASEAIWRRLVERLHRLLDDGAAASVAICFEPEPGMFVDSLAAYRELRRRLARDELGTTLDVGHLLVTESGAPHDHLTGFATTLKNVQLDDARRGVHEHLPLGEGEIDFEPLFAELRRLDYRGPVALELSRDSHRAAQLAEESLRKIRGWLA